MSEVSTTPAAQARRTTPPFRADHVGSFLRPAALLEARERLRNGTIDAADLRRVRGCVELGLRVLWTAPEEHGRRHEGHSLAAAVSAGADGPPSGQAYMLARLAEE